MTNKTSREWPHWVKKGVLALMMAASLLVFSSKAVADGGSGDPMSARISEKSAEWVVGKMNEYIGGLKPPIHLQSTVSSNNGLMGSMDFYSLGDASGVEWFMVVQFNSPAKYSYIQFKRKNEPDEKQEVYFPSLKQRVCRYDSSKSASSFERLMMSGPLDQRSHADIANCAQFMQVYDAGNGNYMLNIHIKQKDAMEFCGAGFLILNTLVDAKGKPLESGMIIDNGSLVMVERYANPAKVTNIRKIISQYLTPALKAPLIKDKSFNQAHSEAVSLAGKGK